VGTIILDHVCKSFGAHNTPSLHPTCLTLEAGSFVTILGASGSGKTTLLKLINRLHKPSGGRILINDQDIASIPVTELRRGIGYVIQQTGLFQHMTVAKNIAVVPEILRWPKARIKQRVDALLALVSLEPSEYRNSYPRQLSGGQQQRVGLARALAGDPDILLMDEPFGAIDPINRLYLQDQILDIQSRLKKTVVFVTHDVQEALKLGDKVIIMNQGKVHQYDTPGAILNNPANAFVAAIIGADDPYRHFNLIQVKEAMSVHYFSEGTQNDEREAHRGLPVIQDDQNLNEALQHILMSPTDYVLVENEQRQIIGEISLENLQENLQRLHEGQRLQHRKPEGEIVSTRECPIL
jgi:osmoprotectant transport system ATP-binding protein